MSEAEKALKILRDRRVREQAEESQPAGEGFEPPTARIEEILGFARDTARKFNILPPPPFLPDIRIPESRRENNGVVERLPKVTETVKPEPPKPQINCPRCHSPSPVGTRYCSVCSWDLNMQYTVDRGYTLRG